MNNEKEYVNISVHRNLSRYLVGHHIVKTRVGYRTGFFQTCPGSSDETWARPGQGLAQDLPIINRLPMGHAIAVYPNPSLFKTNNTFAKLDL